MPDSPDSLVSKLVPAVITGIVGPILTLVVKQIWDGRIWNPITDFGRAAIPGHWEGSGYQADGPGGVPLTFPISFVLKCGWWKLIRGSGTVHFALGSEAYTASFSLEGGFFYERFLKLDYRNDDKDLIQFGTVILELDAGGKLLTGRLVGYGPKRKGVVIVDVNMKKTP